MGQNNETSNGMCMALAPSFSAAFSSVPADYLVKCSEYALKCLGLLMEYFPIWVLLSLWWGYSFQRKLHWNNVTCEFSVHLLVAITILKKKFSSSVVWGHHIISAANSGQNQGPWYNENVLETFTFLLKKKKIFPQLRNLNCWHIWNFLNGYKISCNKKFLEKTLDSIKIRQVVENARGHWGFLKHSRVKIVFFNSCVNKQTSNKDK